MLLAICSQPTRRPLSLQTVFMFGGCLSLYGALMDQRPTGTLDAFAAAVCVVAISLEVVADRQMDAFQAGVWVPYVTH